MDIPMPETRNQLTRGGALAVALRAGLLALFALLSFGWPGRTGWGQQPPRSWLAVAPDARALATLLLVEYPDALDDAARKELHDATRDYREATSVILTVSGRRLYLTPEQAQRSLKEADNLHQIAARRMAAAFQRLPGLIDLAGDAPVRISRSVSLPFESGVLLLHRGRSADATPEFMRKKVDLSAADSVRIDVGSAPNFFCALELVSPPKASGRRRLQLSAGPNPLAEIDLSVAIPPRFPLRVEIRDGDGRLTEAAAGLYSAQRRPSVPAAAIDFSSAGFYYQPVRYRNSRYAKYWPGGDGFTRTFFVSGGFTMELPAGVYRLMASKGPEYLAVDRTISIAADGNGVEKVELRRWIDMSERGWHSGDCHIHYARADKEADQRLLLWTQAEDLRMANILRMGDVAQTYYEQYAYGKEGRFLHPRGALVTGQEDPRTGILGHTLSLNLQAPIRDARRYYLYSPVFDEARRQGGLAGYPHVGNDGFSVRRDMTINVPRGKVDFAEILEFAEVGTELYYEFLNLGFRLTAVAGSDVPWGRTVGESRVYAHTGAKFDPDQWFEAVKRGCTFVTAGPMLEFTVNGRLPGEQLEVVKGQALRVHAEAKVGSPQVPLSRLEIVANGDVVRFADPAGNSAALDFELPADTSLWIAARTTGAHTTPIYVVVDGKRHWKTSEVPALLERRLRVLDEIEKLMDESGAGKAGAQRDMEGESAAVFAETRQELRSMVREARAEYLRLREEVKRGR
jgi:hypothetical protein